MTISTTFEPREYQQQILKLTHQYINSGNNVLIELDCGLGKRYLQYSIIGEIFKGYKILLLLQASTSLYETYNYLKRHLPNIDIELIDSRISSEMRGYKLLNHQIILTLPQTLANTLKKIPNALNNFDLILINEVDQIVKRMGLENSFKHPYPKLMPFLEEKQVIGMSGTLRDEHYVLDKEQIKIKEELKSILEMIGNTHLISMDILSESDLDKHINISHVIPTGVDDNRIALVSSELDIHIKDARDKLLKYVKEENEELYLEAKNDMTKLFGPLPVPPSIAQKFHQGYLVRKYLWSMSGKSSFHHLVNYGLDEQYLKSSLPLVPAKFLAIRELIKPIQKSVVLCSYLDTVETISELIEASGIKTVQITGQIPHQKRIDSLEEFKSSDNQMVAVLSNVGERDLDIPEAELLIVFDLIRTAKTVYQKLKRSRGGICRIMYYDDTRESQKVSSVLEKIAQRYSWSTKIHNPQLIELL